MAGVVCADCRWTRSDHEIASGDEKGLGEEREQSAEGHRRRGECCHEYDLPPEEYRKGDEHREDDDVVTRIGLQGIAGPGAKEGKHEADDEIQPVSSSQTPDRERQQRQAPEDEDEGYLLRECI